MSIFTIGDLHLSLAVGKPMDIFDGWGNYTERLERCWTNIVSPCDTVVVAGDISWGLTLDEAAADFAFLDALPGQKIILKGNHDYWWTTMRKMQNRVAECGFSSIRFLFNNSYIIENVGICGTRSWFYDEDTHDTDKIFLREIGRLKASVASLDLKKCDDAAVFLHYPPIYRGSIVEEIIDILKKSGITRCYYGHLHGASIEHAFNGEYGGIKFKLVSADCLKFAPYKIN